MAHGPYTDRNMEHTATPSLSADELKSLAQQIKAMALSLGFSAVGIAGIDLADDEQRLLAWLDQGRHGQMEWMARHGTQRTRPATLVPGTVRVISVRLDYWPKGAKPADEVLAAPALAYVSRYALGRDYHRLMRNRLQRLAEQIQHQVSPLGFRAFVDSAPVMEKPLARNAGLGWQGKHTNLIDSQHGSWFFLGELYINLALPVDTPSSAHCGSCTACLPACPTKAITAPFELDARRCISYLTIELKGSIPEEFRAPMGNRIYGCDDCQLVCPWNKFAKVSQEQGFEPRHGLDSAQLSALFAWTEQEFLERFSGSPIRRIGYERWQRNLSVALGNAPSTPDVLQSLSLGVNSASALVREHAQWALASHQARNL